jgi:hypothetical protein
MNQKRVRDDIALDPAIMPLGMIEAASREAMVTIDASPIISALVIVLVLILIFG